LNGNGQFVIFAFLPSTADQQSLKLHLYAEDGSGPVASVQTVFVAPATVVSSGSESAAAAVEEEVAASEDPEAETEMASTEAKSSNLEAATAQAANADAAPVAEADAAPVAEAAAAPGAEEVTASKEPESETELASTDMGSSNAEATSAPATVILADEDGVRVLQDGAPAEVAPAVTIDTISYNSNGDVILGGRGQAGNFVRIYLDNQSIATSEIAVDGYWAVELSDIEPGIYTLRIDELNPAGDVVSRAETPFKREAAEELAELMAVETEAEEPRVEVPSESAVVAKAEAEEAQPPAVVQIETETAPEKPLAQAVTQVEVNVQPEVAALDGQDEQSSNGGSAVVEDLPAETAPALRAPSKKFRVRTVQPGSTLWAIAKESYGAGIEYFKVFEANKERIRDPDLIYPGQVFEIPD
jgi:nucleoid-associated protein YgaU